MAAFSHNITSTQTSIHTIDQDDPSSFLQFNLWRTMIFVNLNDIDWKIIRHEKADIKGYPVVFSDFKFLNFFSRQSLPVMQGFGQG